MDWTKPHREDVKAGVRAAVKNVLRRRGLNKEQLEALADKLLTQAWQCSATGRWQREAKLARLKIIWKRPWRLHARRIFLFQAVAENAHGKMFQSDSLHPKTEKLAGKSAEKLSGATRVSIAASSELPLPTGKSLKTWLPRTYTPDPYRQKCSTWFEHVYESYPERDAGSNSAPS